MCAATPTPTAVEAVSAGPNVDADTSSNERELALRPESRPTRPHVDPETPFAAERRRAAQRTIPLLEVTRERRGPPTALISLSDVSSSVWRGDLASQTRKGR